jgi:hypothetical protein
MVVYVVNVVHVEGVKQNGGGLCFLKILNIRFYKTIEPISHILSKSIFGQGFCNFKLFTTTTTR